MNHFAQPYLQMTHSPILTVSKNGSSLPHAKEVYFTTFLYQYSTYKRCMRLKVSELNYTTHSMQGPPPEDLKQLSHE